MKDGCIFSNNHKCSKYNVLCSGYVGEKSGCPDWGSVFAVEKYYNEKLEYDSMLSDDIREIINAYYNQKGK